MNQSNMPQLPTAFERADAFSLSGQRRTILGTSWRLVLIVVAAVLLALAPLWPSATGNIEHGEHRELEVAAIAAAALFLAAFVIELRQLRSRPERDWYDGRAVAESAKTLSWRFAVGGAPYPIDRPNAPESFANDVRELGTDVDSLRDALVDGGKPTVWMGEVRNGPLKERREVYLRGRVRDQEEWYSLKAAHNRRRATFWSVILLATEAFGVVLALLKGLGVVSIDLASVAAAIIASGAAWLAVKQHESIATAYALASSELGSVHVRLLAIDDEAVWAEEVGSAEEAISREHTMWRASRSRLDPPSAHH